MENWQWIALFDTFVLIFWSVTYIECIRKGFEDKTYCIPFFAICMNYSVEILCLVHCFITYDTRVLTYVVHSLQVMLDTGIVITYLKYGKRELALLLSHQNIKNRLCVGKYFVIRTIVNALVVIMVLTICYIYVSNWKGYFQFVDNLIMSVLFIAMYFVRKGNRGQNLCIAITKMLGTLSATLMVGVVSKVIPILVIGLICFVLDIAYIIIFAKHPKLLHIKRK